MNMLAISGIISLVCIWFNLKYHNAFISYIGLFSSAVFSLEVFNLSNDFTIQTLSAGFTSFLIIYHFIFAVKNSVDKRFINY